jgi:hypothetical protein
LHWHRPEVWTMTRQMVSFQMSVFFSLVFLFGIVLR